MIDAVTDLFILRELPTFIGSDNGTEFVAQALDTETYIVANGAYLEPVSPCENRYRGASMVGSKQIRSFETCFKTPVSLDLFEASLGPQQTW